MRRRDRPGALLSIFSQLPLALHSRLTSIFSEVYWKTWLMYNSFFILQTASVITGTAGVLFPDVARTLLIYPKAILCSSSTAG
jgi:hypothetical protein